MTLKTRLSRLEAAAVPNPQTIETWFTLDGEPTTPPADVAAQVEAAARDVASTWRSAVWLPDEGLACLLGEADDDVQFVELG